MAPGGSYDYVAGSYGVPALAGTTGHGTAVAGLAAARAGNRQGGVGVAYDAELVSLNMIPKVALGPLILVWFSYGIRPNIAMAFAICFFPIVRYIPIQPKN